MITSSYTMNRIPSVNDTYFQHKLLSKIHGQPSYESLQAVSLMPARSPPRWAADSMVIKASYYRTHVTQLCLTESFGCHLVIHAPSYLLQPAWALRLKLLVTFSVDLNNNSKSVKLQTRRLLPNLLKLSIPSIFAPC